MKKLFAIIILVVIVAVSSCKNPEMDMKMSETFIDDRDSATTVIMFRGFSFTVYFIETPYGNYIVNSEGGIVAVKD